PRALRLATTFASRAGDEAQAQTLLGRLVKGYPDAPELPEALYLPGASAEARGQRELAARTYRELRLLLPASDYADGAADRLAALEAAGLTPAPLTLEERVERADRLVRGGVAQTAIDEAERIVAEARESAVSLRALRVIADGARKLGRAGAWAGSRGWRATRAARRRSGRASPGAGWTARTGSWRSTGRGARAPRRATERSRSGSSRRCSPRCRGATTACSPRHGSPVDPCRGSRRG